ncbi:MAG: hypothetical protein LBS01_11835 [Prevotellaceae bacterium]|jgi:hypothetical protein|nr:hypothetical protein [Prevotellaceae bacterium]
MTKKIVLFLALAMFASASITAQNSDSAPEQKKETKEKKKSKFGSFIKRAGEAATGINMSSETFVVMNLEAKQLIEMDVASCIGDSKSQTVILTLTVKAKKNGVKTALGKSCGNGNQECVSGYDTKGNSYEGQEIGKYSEISGSKENPAGIPVQYQFGFTAIPSTLKNIEVVMVEFYIYADKNIGSNMSKVEPIQVRNIPIQWDPVAE